MKEATEIIQKNSFHIESIVIPIKDELISIAMEIKPSSRSDFINHTLFLCPQFAGDEDEHSCRNDCEIQVEFLKILENKNAIKKFDIKSQDITDDYGSPTEFITAEIKFCPSRLIEFFKDEKSKKTIEFFCENGSCFIKFGSKSPVKI